MIKIKSSVGDFIIDKGVLKSDDRFIKEVFKAATAEFIKIEDGDVDYALAQQMKDYILGFKIDEFTPEPIKKNVKY